MKLYTANQLQALVEAAYTRGYQDGKLRRDDQPTPPRFEEFVEHVYQPPLLEGRAR